MENLMALVDSLKTGEIQLLQHFYSFKNNPEIKKRDKLLKLVITKEITEEEKAMIYLYGERSNSAFSQLKTRLKEDIMNVLLMQDPSVKFSTLYAQAAFDCRRALIQGEILLSRGVYQEAVSVLTRASKLAKKYELYAEQLQLDDLLRNHLTMKQNTKSFNELSESINTALEKLTGLQNAKYIHYLLTVPGLFSMMNPGKDINKEGEKIISDLEEELQRTNSTRVRFYYHLAALNFYSHTRDHEKAHHHGASLLQLVESDGIVQSRTNIAGTKMELANVMLHLSRNTEAMTLAQQSMQHFKPGMINELEAIYKVFFAYFRENDITNAEIILNKALKHKQLKFNETLNARWLLIRSALEFKKGMHEQSMKTLKKDNTLTRDKTGWLWGYYLIEIMNLFEMNGGSDWVDSRVESLKKVIYRYSDKLEIENPRGLIIYKILQSLISNNYDFSATVKQEKANIEKLSKGDGKYYWDPTSFEVIRFDEWLLEKAKQKNR